jgi:hypothetical protein
VRELSDDNVSRQALALHSYVARGGDEVAWWQSKGFAPADAKAIKREFLRRLASCGVRDLAGGAA